MQRLVERLARLSAAAGGIVLVALIAMTCLSILGRGLNTLAHKVLAGGQLGFISDALIALRVGPVTGDFELVEAGIAFAVFAFLPLCQLQSGHASVDVFTSGLPPKANRMLLAFWEAMFAAVMILAAQRLLEGTLAKFRNGETSLLLQYPLWTAYAACLLPAFVAAVTALWSAWDRMRAVITGRDSRAISGDVVH